MTGATAKTYTSSNSSVVKVSKKGALTAKKAGKATISVKASNGKTYKCKVTVNAYALNKTKLSLNAGDTYALSLKGIDKNTYVCWTSSNTQVATVDFDGKVTAKGKGTTTISAEVDGAVYKCKVTVHEHTMEWKAESDAHGAKAQWICTGCREIMKEGVQLIAENGEKRYGYWNTTVTDADMLKRLNQKLQSEGFQAMVEDATLESVYQWLRPRNEYKNVSYTHRFAMISFVWDAYEDGSDYITIYVFASVNDTNES